MAMGIIYTLNMSRAELHEALGRDLNILTLNIGDDGSRVVPIVLGTNEYTKTDAKRETADVYLAMEHGDKRYVGNVLEFLRLRTGREITAAQERTVG